MRINKNVNFLVSLVLILVLALAGCSGGTATDDTSTKDTSAEETKAGDASTEDTDAADASTEDTGAADIPETIKVGVVLPLTGSLALLGNDVLTGYQLAQEKINSSGGFWDNHKIEFVIGDAENDAAKAVSETERLISQENVSCLVGTFSSTLAYAATQAAEKYKVPYLEAIAVANNILVDRNFKYVFRTVPDTTMYGQQHVTFVTEVVKAEKIAILAEDGIFGQAVAEGARIEAERLGIEVVVDEAYSAKTNDLSSVVLKLKAAQPDAIIAVSYFTDAILMARQMIELGYTPPAFVGTGAGHGTPDFATTMEKNADGFAVMQGFNTDFTVAGAQEFVEAYTQKTGKMPSGHDAGQGYAAIMVLGDVLSRTKSLDSEALREAFAETDISETMAGWGVQFDESGQNIRAQLSVGQWQDGSLLTVWPAEVATSTFGYPMSEWSER